jgi:haloalkane dehalogenase
VREHFRDDSNNRGMNRRRFITLTSAGAVAVALDRNVFAKHAQSQGTIDAEWYRRSRRYQKLPISKVAYVEHGHGPAALFLHGFPLTGYQWRGALERLHPHRRCIAPDLMSMGYTETPEGQAITPDTQVEMLEALLNSLRVKRVDIVANDSGGLVAQLFVARHPDRVRTLLLTNCDVDENNPPKDFVPAVELAKKNVFAEKFLLPQLRDKQLARSTRNGMLGSAFTYPERLSDETLDIYLQPIVASKTRMMQMDEYTISLGVNELPAKREQLRRWNGHARMVWAIKDQFFPVKWAEWLDHNLPKSTGVRRIEDAKLFFPEEMPDVIAQEARRLWQMS